MNRDLFRRPEPILISFFCLISISTFVTNTGIVTIGFVLLSLWGSLIFYQNAVFFKSLRQTFGGNIRRKVQTPRPSSSMISSLNLQGVRTTDIKHIDLMTFDLIDAKTYLESHGLKFRAAVSANSELTVRIFGSGQIPEENDIPGLSYFNTVEQLIEHVNLITSKDGRRFVWYEPIHTCSDGEHKLPMGAYLIEVNDDAAWDAAQNRFENLELKAA